MKLPLVAIVGAPNVGKSTLFNRLIGQRRAIVTDEPGVTRDRLYGVVSQGTRPFRLVDTGGLTFGSDAELGREIEGQAQRALQEASCVVFVVDARAGVGALDMEVASMLRRRALPVVLVANKIDAPSVEPLVLELYSLGFGDPIAVSAEHGLGTEDLLDAILGRLPPASDTDSAIESEDGPPIAVAIVGRPNVGKSSILNRILGEERVLVSEVPGTTRDAVDTLLERDGRRFLLIDTAGIRRKGKVRLVAESLSVARAHRAIERADVVILVLAADDAFAAQDAHIVGYADSAWKPVVVAVNKWDLVERREEAAQAWERELRQRLRFVKGPPLAFISAKSGQRVSKLLDFADEQYRTAGLKVSTPELNRWLQGAASAERSSPAKGRSIRLFYAAQTGVHPPRFVLFCNDARRVHFSLRRHLANSLRERFSFGSVPLQLQFRSRRERKVS